MHKITLFLLAIFLSCTPARTQSVKQVEDKIIHYLKRIDYWHDKGDNSDSLSATNESLLNYLKETGQKQPATISALFDKIDRGQMKIITSDDKKLRIYNWDTWTGGTMHYFYTVAQYQAENSTRTAQLNMPDTSKDGGDPGYMYTGINTIRTKGGKTFYLVFYSGIYSTKDVSIGIKAFAIENGKLDDSIKVFKTSQKTLNSIDCSYDYFSNYNTKTTKENYLIHLSGDKQKLFIPVVTEDKMTGRFLVYKFDGNNYVFDKNAK